MAEIDLLLSGTEEADPADVVPEVAPGPAVTRLGDIWQIGPHRLICGDSTQADTYARLLDGERAQMVFTDPPYNVKIDGHVSGLGAAKHREFAMASGEMTETEFTGFLARVFASLVAHAIDGAIHFVCMDWRDVGEVLAAAPPSPDDLLSIGVPTDWLADVTAATEDGFFDLAGHLPSEAGEALLEYASSGIL